MRGQLFELGGKRIFTMGGAASHDISDGILNPDDPEYKKQKALLDKQGKYMYRINHLSWWQEEMPSDAEYATARSTLEACGWNVDCIFTHSGPSSIVDILGNGFYQHDHLTDFLEEISQKSLLSVGFSGITMRAAISGKSISACMIRLLSCRSSRQMYDYSVSHDCSLL